MDSWTLRLAKWRISAHVGAGNAHDLPLVLLCCLMGWAVHCANRECVRYPEGTSIHLTDFRAYMLYPRTVTSTCSMCQLQVPIQTKSQSQPTQAEKHTRGKSKRREQRAGVWGLSGVKGM